jgi:hypothetical protein
VILIFIEQYFWFNTLYYIRAREFIYYETTRAKSHRQLNLTSLFNAQYNIIMRSLRARQRNGFLVLALKIFPFIGMEISSLSGINTENLV